MVFKTLTKALKFSIVGLLIVSAGCKKDKKEQTQTQTIQAKWYTKQIVTTITNVSSGATTFSNTNTSFTTTDFTTFDSNSKYSSSGSPLSGDYGSYTINNSNVLTLTSAKAANSSSTYTIVKLDDSNLTLESTTTASNQKTVVDIMMSK